ncbi:MAG: PorV/PorQ family protein [Candidatus Delongbacteria bacterium]|nr:PorV/PorQ family protein [Candidatus Delongbacteria bacterium]MDD4205992.1 PorV/PorQ family protein [Candidatus Delongbacteria bacterium]
MKKLLFSLLLAMILLPIDSFAQDKAGTAGMTFLKMDVSARATALAGSFIGLSDDASCLYYNPSGMMNLKNMEFAASYNMYAADVQYTYMAGTYPLPMLNASAGVQVAYLTTGDMDETTPLNPEGTGRTFGASDLMIGLSYAQMLTPKFYVGGTLKMINENLADESVFVLAGDVGTYYNTGWRSLIFGMSIRHFGSNFTYLDEDSPLPMLFVFGVSYTAMDDGVNKIVTLAEAAHPSDNSEYVTLGCEYSYNDMFFARIGRKIDNDEYWIMKDDSVDFPENADPADPELNYEDSGINWMGTSLGLGFKMNNLGMKVDYSWKHMGYLSSTHMITLGYTIR